MKDKERGVERANHFKAVHRDRRTTQTLRFCDRWMSWRGIFAARASFQSSLGLTLGRTTFHDPLQFPGQFLGGSFVCEPTPLFDDGVVLQDDKGWELLDVVTFRDFTFLVHVDFAKRHFREVLVESIVGGLELLAGLAPRCVEVHARGFASLRTFHFGFVRRGVGLLRLAFRFLHCKTVVAVISST